MGVGGDHRVKPGVTSLRRTAVERLRMRRGRHDNSHKGRAGTNRDGVGKAVGEASYKVE